MAALSWVQVVNRWIIEGLEVSFDLEKLTRTTTIKANKEKDVVSVVGRGLLLPSYILFDSPKCGVRFRADNFDTERYYTVERLKDLGATSPNNWIYTPRYETGYYAIAIILAPFSREKLELKIFNDDTSNHNVLSYSVPYVKASARSEL